MDVSSNADRLHADRLHWVAVALAFVVSGIHLFHPIYGGPALLVYANVGYLGDPRPLLFLAGGFLLVFAAVLALQGVYLRLAYATMAAVSLAFLVGYGLWHTVLDHGAFWPHIHGHGHDGNPVVVLWAHVTGDAVDFVSKLTEAALAVVSLLLVRATGDEP